MSRTRQQPADDLGLALADPGVVGEAGRDERGGQVPAQPRRAATRPSSWPGPPAATVKSSPRSGSRIDPATSPSQATLTHHCGIPKRKFTVPSSGSTTQRRPVCRARRRPPRRGSRRRGRRAASTARIAALGGEVGLADQVGRGRLRAHLDLAGRAEVRQQHRAAGPGGLDRDLEDLVAVRRRHPRAAGGRPTGARPRAGRRGPAGAPRRPGATSCTASGKPWRRTRPGPTPPGGRRRSRRRATAPSRTTR